MSGIKLKPKPKQLIVVFTDGSCSRNGRKGAIGGIGVHFPNGELADVSKIYSRGPCTNQKTELYAILTALRYINQNLSLEKYNVLIKTDSNYSINCVTTWINGWIRNGWVNSKGDPVANREFIEPIHKYVGLYDIEFEHVSAHTNSDDPDSLGNDMADTLATRATQRAIAEVAKAASAKALNRTNTGTRSGSKTRGTANTRGRGQGQARGSARGRAPAKRGGSNARTRTRAAPDPDDIEVELIG